MDGTTRATDKASRQEQDMVLSAIGTIGLGTIASSLADLSKTAPVTPELQAKGEAVVAARDNLRTAGPAVYRDLMTEYGQSIQKIAADGSIDFSKPENMNLFSKDEHLNSLRHSLDAVTHNSALAKPGDVHNLVRSALYNQTAPGYGAISARPVTPLIPEHLSASVKQYNGFVADHQTSLDAIRDSERTFERSKMNVTGKAAIGLAGGVLADTVLDHTLLSNRSQDSLWALVSDLAVPIAAGVFTRKIGIAGVFASTVVAHTTEKLLAERKLTEG